jgi:hypothetical protein
MAKFSVNFYSFAIISTIGKWVALHLYNFESPLPKGGTSCCNQGVVVSFSTREVVSSSHARTGRVKPKTFKVGSECSFVLSTAFRSENHGSLRYGKELSLLKAVSAKHRSKFIALSPVW